MVHIRIGAGWKENPDVRVALRRATAPARTAEAARSIIDVMAIEVDGIDIAAGRTEGSVFAAAEGLVRAVERLVAGEPQASVHFHEGAVELLLRRRGTSALLSVVTLARPARMLARDVEVDLEALAGAAREAAAALCGDLAEIQPLAARAPFAKMLLQSASRLGGMRPCPMDAPPLPETAKPHRPRRRRGAPVCGFELRDEEGLVQGYRGPGPELGSLLAPGRVFLRAPGNEEVFRVQGVPFLLFRDLAAAAARLASAVRAGDSRFAAALALPGRKGTLSLEVDLARGTLSVNGGPAADCAPLALAQAFLEAAVDFCVAVTARNPRQAANGYLAELSSSASERLAHVRELMAGDLVTAARANVRPPRTRPAPRAPLGPGRMKRLAFRAGWTADAGIPSGPGLLRTGDLVVACGARATLGLAADTGQTQWRLPGSASAAPAEGALVLAGPQRLTCVDLASGAPRWSRPYAGPLPRSLVPLGDGIVALVGCASVSALHVPSGRAPWRFDPPAATSLCAAGFGELLVVGADTGLVYGVERGGRVAWRLRAPGPLASSPRPWHDMGIVLCQTERGGSVIAFDPGSGRRRWEAPLEFTPSGPPLAFGALLAVAGLVAGDPVIAAIEPGGASAWTSAASIGSGALALAALPTALLAKSADGACAAFDPSGALIWNCPAVSAHPAPGNLPPVAARGVVLVPAEQVTALDADTGAHLGEAPVLAPAHLAVDPDLTIYGMDSEGAVTSARLATHLSIVTPG